MHSNLFTNLTFLKKELTKFQRKLKFLNLHMDRYKLKNCGKTLVSIGYELDNDTVVVPTFLNDLTRLEITDNKLGSYLDLVQRFNPDYQSIISRDEFRSILHFYLNREKGYALFKTGLTNEFKYDFKACQTRFLAMSKEKGREMDVYEIFGMAGLCEDDYIDVILDPTAHNGDCAIPVLIDKLDIIITAINELSDDQPVVRLQKLRDYLNGLEPEKRRLVEAAINCIDKAIFRLSMPTTDPDETNHVS